MSNEKIVEIKEVSTGKTRLFRKRENVVVLTPKDVLDEYEGVPLSITITPMSHGDAELRKRKKKAYSVAMDVSNRQVGITQTMITEYMSGLSTLDSDSSDTDSESKLEELKEFQNKWEHFQDKSNMRNMVPVYKAEDELRRNAVKVVSDNCVCLNFEDGGTIEIDDSTIDDIHPDLFYWVLSSIEKESYLTTGEVLGFQ